MAKKYYAVRKGKEPGIYETWDECKAQTAGFSGAEYKSFPTIEEAEAFMNKETAKTIEMNYTLEDLIEKYNTPEKAVAFVDGSYDESQKKYSYGLVLVCNGEVFEEGLADFEPIMLVMNNVAGEILGAQMAMTYCLEKGVKELDLFYDYEGIAKWCLDDWKATKPATIDYKEFYNSIKDKLKVTFYKVPAHEGFEINEKVDKLAKAALGLQ